MTTGSIPPSDRPSFGERMGLAFGAFVRALLRLLLIVLVAGAIGAGIYFAAPWLYRQYVQPIQSGINQNTNQIEDLEARQEQDTQQLTERISDLQERLDNMDVLRDQDKQTFSELAAGVDALNAQAVEMEAMLGEQGNSLGVTLERLDEMDATIASLDGALDRLGNMVGQVASDLDGVALDVEDNRLQAEALAEAFSDAENPLNSLRRELNLLKAMESITRSRLFLGQRNLGLMEQDLLTARDLLAGLQPQVPDYQQEALVTIIDRLDVALENLSDDDLDLVASDLEVAWQLLVEGLPSEPVVEVEEVAPTPEGTVTPTDQPEATPEVTPTPTP